MFSLFIWYFILNTFYIYFESVVILMQSFIFHNLVGLNSSLAFVHQANLTNHYTSNVYYYFYIQLVISYNKLIAIS